MESREKHGVLSHTPTPERKKQLVDFHEQFKEFKFIEICLYYFLVTVIFVIFQFVFFNSYGYFTNNCCQFFCRAQTPEPKILGIILRSLTVYEIYLIQFSFFNSAP